MSAANSPLAKSGEPVTWNFKLLAQNNLGGFGGMGEGMAVQIAKDGRRIIWLAHESAPKNFTAVDVSDPRNLKVVVQTESAARPHALELAGIVRRHSGGRLPDAEEGQKPAGLELFDVSVPEKPRSISFFDCSGATSRGVHQLWFCDGEYVHMAAGADDFTPSHPLDDQFYRCIDVRNPSKPSEAGRWWMPGTQEGRERRCRATRSTRAIARTIPMSIRKRPDRLVSLLHRRRHVHHGHRRQVEAQADLALDQFAALHRLHAYGGAAVRPQLARRHRRVDRERRQGLAEAGLAARQRATRPIRCRSPRCPMPPVDAYKHRGGRFGAHNICSRIRRCRPRCSRTRHRVRHLLQRRLARLRHLEPYQPKEIAAFVPPAPNGSPARRGAAQRRVRRRARHRLHDGPPHRRALHAGDGFLVQQLSCAGACPGHLA